MAKIHIFTFQIILTKEKFLIVQSGRYYANWNSIVEHLIISFLFFLNFYFSLAFFTEFKFATKVNE